MIRIYIWKVYLEIYNKPVTREISRHRKLVFVVFGFYCISLLVYLKRTDKKKKKELPHYYLLFLEPY